jgi:TonB-like protein
MRRLFITLYFFIISFCSFSQVIEEDYLPITPSPHESKDNIYIIVDEQPEFVGGEEALQKFYHEKSPHPVVGEKEEALVVYYQIVIDENGDVIHFKILHSKSEKLNEITQKIVSKMPKWKPGVNKGIPVKVAKNLAVRYAILE